MEHLSIEIAVRVALQSGRRKREVNPEFLCHRAGICGRIKLPVSTGLMQPFNLFLREPSGFVGHVGFEKPYVV